MPVAMCYPKLGAAAGAPTTWTNHVAIKMPGSGSTVHAVDPASGGTVASGAYFTPTAGRLLVCVVEGAQTSSTPSGWTLPSGGSAINNTGLYVWHRSAAGGDTFSTTHNGNNFPSMFHFFEFAAGASFVAAAAGTGVSYSGSNPTLSGLSGVNHLFGVVALGIGTIGDPAGSAVAWTGATEIADVLQTSNGTVDGYLYSIACLENSVLSSFTPTGAVANTPPSSPQKEALSFAVKLS